MNNSKKIIIMGKGPGWEGAPSNFDGEIWALNGLLFQKKYKIDKMFMMDVLEDMPSVLAGYWTVQQVTDKINETKIPFITPYLRPDIKTSEAFPIREVVEKFNVPYFSNTICYMIAYALLKEVESIDIWGINQASGTEYFYEKSAVEFWLGVALGRGVNVTVNGARSELLRFKDRLGANRLYGYNKTYEQILADQKVEIITEELQK